MNLFADIILDPATLAVWIGVGLVVAWIAGMMMESPSYGSVGEFIAGGLGALVGGLLFGVLAGTNPNYWGAVMCALIGACIGIGGTRAFMAYRNA